MASDQAHHKDSREGHARGARAADSALAEAASAAKGPARRPPQGQGRARDRASLRSDQNRLAELKVKLGDEDYMNGAILRIAHGAERSIDATLTREK